MKKPSITIIIVAMRQEKGSNHGKETAVKMRREMSLVEKNKSKAMRLMQRRK